MKTTNFGRTLRNLVLAGAVAATSAGALAAPALARDWDDYRGDGRGREWRDRDDRRVWVTPGYYGYGYAYNPYGYYYAPAPVYAPPVVSFGFSFR